MITISEDQIERARILLASMPGSVQKAVSAAINRAAEGARTDGSKKAREEYIIASGRIRETINISKASSANLSARVSATGRPRALSYFKVRPSRPLKKQTKTPLFAQVKRDGGGTIAGAFVAKLKSGHLGVFNRTNNVTSNGKVELAQRYGPSVPQMLGSKTVTAFVEEGASRRIEERLDHEISRILRGQGK